MSDIKSKEEIRRERGDAAAKRNEEIKKANKPAEDAREERDEYRADQHKLAAKRTMAKVEAEAEAVEEEKGGADVKTLSTKPGSGAGLKPGDWFAPSSNPGAAAMVPDQPLQPEMMQSHGKGIVHDKDLDNPPYGTGDPYATDESPSGTFSESDVDKKAERVKAGKATGRSRMADPDNPTSMGREGKGDATASPNPIGSTGSSKNSRAGGSNPGTKE